MCSYRSAREIGSDGSEMIGEMCRQSCFGLADIQHRAALADNGIEQISRGAGKWRCNVMTNSVRTGNFNCVKNMHTRFASGSFAFSTQQNSYSISHLLGTVTTQWLPLWRCSHCSLVPDTVTTEQWLHRTHTLLGIHYHGAYVEICLLGT